MSDLNHNNPPAGMHVVIKVITSWMKGFILIFGIMMALYGHLLHGGGFAGGVITACAFILITLAEGQKECMKYLNKEWALRLFCLGALIFLAAGLAGIFGSQAFFQNNGGGEAARGPLAAGIIPLCDIGIWLNVSAGLFLIFTVLSATHIEPKTTGQTAARPPEEGT